MANKKKRLDTLLVEQGFFPSREKAKRSIMAGLIYVGDKLIDKPGTFIDPSLQIQIRGKVHPFVGRGGLKLAKALKSFQIDVHDLCAVDAGASTGGFTDCLLQQGAAKVFAVDVGYGQLDWKLRCDPRVVVLERTNVRYLTVDDLGEFVDLVTADLAFISLTKVFENLLQLLTNSGRVIALIKPQFEAGRALVGKNGVVRDFKVHIDVLLHLLPQLQNFGAGLIALDYSPIQGPSGNVEYLAYFRKNRQPINPCELIYKTVELAQREFAVT